MVGDVEASVVVVENVEMSIVVFGKREVSIVIVEEVVVSVAVVEKVAVFVAVWKIWRLWRRKTMTRNMKATKTSSNRHLGRYSVLRPDATKLNLLSLAHVPLLSTTAFCRHSTTYLGLWAPTSQSVDANLSALLATSITLSVDTASLRLV